MRHGTATGGVRGDGWPASSTSRRGTSFLLLVPSFLCCSSLFRRNRARVFWGVIKEGTFYLKGDDLGYVAVIVLLFVQYNLMECSELRSITKVFFVEVIAT